MAPTGAKRRYKGDRLQSLWNPPPLMSPESADISGSPTESGAREDIEKISFNDSNAAVALDCEDVDRSAVERRYLHTSD